MNFYRNDKSNIGFLIQPEFSQMSYQPLPRRMLPEVIVYMYIIMKKIYIKSELEGIFLELAANNKSNRNLML